MVTLTVLIFILSLVGFSLLMRCFSFSLPSSILHRQSPLDGLRGLLALLVFTHHYVISYYWIQTGQWTSPESQILDNFGSIPVQLFFMITGYLFTKKIFFSGEVDFAKLYISRIKRICPLYYAIITIVFIISFSLIEWKHVVFREIFQNCLDWMLFLGLNISNFNASRIIAGVEWTLSYEWVFYFSLPLIYFVIKPRKIFISKNIAILIACIFFVYYLSKNLSVTFFILFLYGSFPALFEKFFSQSKCFFCSRIIGAASLIILFINFIFEPAYSQIQMLLTGMFFFILVFGQHFFYILHEKAIVFLGEISFSIYMLHGLVMYLLFTYFKLIPVVGISYADYLFYYPLIFLSIVLLSTLTNFYIERPFQKSSKTTSPKIPFKRLIKKFSNLLKNLDFKG